MRSVLIPYNLNLKDLKMKRDDSQPKKMRIPLPKQTEQPFGKKRYDRTEKYRKNWEDWIEEDEEDNDDEY